MLARGTPSPICISITSWRSEFRTRNLTVIEDRIKGYLQRSGQLLQSLQRGYCMAVFYSGNVRAEQSRAVLDFSLRKFPVFPYSSQTITDDHPHLQSPIALDRPRLGMKTQKTPNLQTKLSLSKRFVQQIGPRAQSIL